MKTKRFALAVPLLALLATGVASGEGADAQRSAMRSKTPPATSTRSRGPDFDVDADLAARHLWQDREWFSSRDCAVVEGCVAAPGTRKLLHFYARIENRGDQDFLVGDPSSPDNADKFVWSSCHGHYHLQHWALYELVDARDGRTRLTGRKQAFCLMDSARVAGTSPGQFNCGFQGISSGWADDYADNLPCQWLDVTDIPAGNYILRVTVNPDHFFPETDYSNNVANIPVQIQ